MRGKYAKGHDKPKPPPATKPGPIESAPTRFIPLSELRLRRQRFELPPESRWWPDDLPEPRAMASSVRLDDGMYYKAAPDGELRFVTTVRGGRISQTVMVANGEGSFFSGGGYWTAERYYADGRMEDFARDDDTSPAYKAPVSFAKWVNSRVRSMIPPKGLAKIPDSLQAGMEFLANSKHELPPHPERVLSTDGEAPENLADLVKGLYGMPWTHRMQCHERLVNYAKWEPALARDFTNFAPEACAWVTRKPSLRQDPAVYLHPAWDDNNHPVVEARLDTVPLFLAVRDLTAAGEIQWRQDNKHWVHVLASLTPAVSPESSRRACPVVWTNPPEGTCGFWRTMVAMELFLRQQASRHAALWSYLESVDRERFFRAASVAGAFLQASHCTGDDYFRPDQLPWKGGSDWIAFAQTVASLIAELDEAPARPNPPFAPPILAAFGHWVHRQCSSAPPCEPNLPGLLGSFLNARADELWRRFENHSVGKVYFEPDSLSPGWPDPHRRSDWEQHRRNIGAPLRQRGTELARRLKLADKLIGFSLNAFLLRVELAGLVLSGHDPGSFAPDLSADLDRYVAAHLDWSQHELTLLGQRMGGVPTVPGAAYRRMINLARWTFTEWSTDPSPTALFPEALMLGHWMLSAL